MKWTICRRLRHDDHAAVDERLGHLEHEQEKMAKRVRTLEIEAGIYKPRPMGMKET